MTDKPPTWPNGGDNSLVIPMHPPRRKRSVDTEMASTHSYTNNAGSRVCGGVHCHLMATTTRYNRTTGHDTITQTQRASTNQSQPTTNQPPTSLRLVGTNVLPTTQLPSITHPSSLMASMSDILLFTQQPTFNP